MSSATFKQGCGVAAAEGIAVVELTSSLIFPSDNKNTDSNPVTLESADPAGAADPSATGTFREYSIET